jgi:hypothetical protein
MKYYLHTSSLHRASPLHDKRRNQEGSHATRSQLPESLGSIMEMEQLFNEDEEVLPGG